MTKRLYSHKTDGGAEYLCLKPIEGTDEGDLWTTVIRLDGVPELMGKFENIEEVNAELLEALRQIEGMCNMPEVKYAMIKHEQSYYHVVMNAVRKAISKAEG